ncbi:transcription/translation regulatory transformer protein RfaH [Halomonas cibimaris]|uniref:Transcription/translation regulatory transformer protein RfaH n=1 Tax=Halomonas cibimaris TaxID=657012 RepID=A0ABP7LFR6_9GAMM
MSITHLKGGCAITTPPSLDAHHAAWYVVQCKAGESFRAAEQLANQHFQVFHPVLERKRRRQGKLTWVCEPLFPFYLFIQLDTINSNWRPIRSTRGVLRIVSFGHVPAAVPDALVASLQRCPHRREGAHTRFSAGDCVRIADGPFKGISAVFQYAKGTERAVVLLNMLQQPRPVEMPSDHLTD